jgi:hypothetical protein
MSDYWNAVDSILQAISDSEEAQLDELVDHYISSSKDLLRDNERQRYSFTERHRREWGKALDLLGRMHFLSLDVGRRFNGQCRESEATGPLASLFDVLTRLHGRSCLVASEIRVLLSSGHASGAQARWRTLFETVVVMLFVASHGEEVAERYLLHERMTTAEAAEEYEKYQDKLAVEPLGEKETVRLRETYDQLKSEYGGEFATDYGWAAPALKQEGIDTGGRTGLSQIAQSVGLDHLWPYYTLANHSVHAGSKAITFNLGLMDGPNRILSGPSNYGLTDPASCTAVMLEHSLLPLLMYGIRRFDQEKPAPEIVTSEMVEVALAVDAITQLSKRCQEEFDSVQRGIEERERERQETWGGVDWEEAINWDELGDMDKEHD